MNEILNVKVDKLYKVENNQRVIAFADLNFGDLFLIKGFCIYKDGRGNKCLRTPAMLGKSGKVYSVFVPVTKEIREYIKEVILGALGDALGMNHTPQELPEPKETLRDIIRTEVTHLGGQYE